MLKTPYMADKNNGESRKDRSPPVHISPWPRRASSKTSPRMGLDSGGVAIRLGRNQGVELDQGPLSSLPFPSDRRDGRLTRNTTVMTIHSDSEPDFEDAPQAFPSGRRDRRLTRNTTVMTIHSDSELELEPDYADSTLALSPERKPRGLMRNTTVMTLHSDSDLDPEDVHEFSMPLQGLSTLDEGASIIFDNGLSSITSDRSENSHNDIDTWRGSRGMKNRGGANSDIHRFAWPGPKPEEEQGTSVDDEYTRPAEIFVQRSGVAYEVPTDEEEKTEEEEEEEEEEDEDEEPENDDEDESEDGRTGLRAVFGSYLLAPMGFDDDESAGNPPGFEGYSEAAERFQIFAGVNEFDESDQIGFGDHSYQVIPKSKRRDQERILENKRRQGKLLLVSLLDNFCLLYDQSPERNRKLFYVICKTLSNMGIIDEEYLEEMSAVRSSYQRAFRSLVVSALTSIKQEQMILESRRIMAPPSTPNGHPQDRRGSRSSEMSLGDGTQSISDSPSSKGIVPSVYLHTPLGHDSAFASTAAMMRTMSFGDMFDNDPTRYKHDFVEICKLGKGGFASVFKARNKLDAIEYAIKKIRLRGGAKVRYEKIFREIKFLARLDHKNVIRYYSSWLEHADYPVSRREMYDGSGGGDFDSNGDLDDEYDDEYGDEDDCTNTISMHEDTSIPERFRRRSSTDYFSPHRDQHASDPEDLSMGIVFGVDDDEDDDGIGFEESQGPTDLDEDSFGLQGSVQTSQDIIDGENMERTHSASSTLTSRNIPGATKGARRRKHQSPTVSQEMHGATPTWEESENFSSKTRSSLSNSYSALSSSIEEIQRSLPSSYSGLGSRYSRSHPKDRALAVLEDEHELRPFSFPNLRETNKKDFVGGGLGGLHGLGRSRGDNSQRHLRNSTGQLVTRDLTLFIQMQLCQTTLQDYLVYRNERPTSMTRKLPAELDRKPSKTNRFGIHSSPSDPADQKTHSAPGSPIEQTCHKDLVDPAANQHIFRAIAEGVAYIHDQDMIHRDLKPGNIFLGMLPGIEHQRAQQLRQDQCSQDFFSYTSSNSSSHFGAVATRSGTGSSTDVSSGLFSTDPAQFPLTKEQIQEELFMNIESMVPKIGDFGLVTDMEGGATLDTDGSQNNVSAFTPGVTSGAAPLLRRHSSSVTTGSRSSRTRTTAVGTVTYASPEQLARPNLGYDQKADIYSLGIIFFELYHPFSTLMERHAVLRTLRNGELPPDFVSRWPKEAAFVLWLMAEDPRMRPTAREILEFDLIRKPKEEFDINASSAVGPGVVTDDRQATTNENGIDSGRSTGEPGKTSERLHGLGLGTDASEIAGQISGASLTMAACATARVICEGCQARCRCFEAVAEATASAGVSIMNGVDPKNATTVDNVDLSAARRSSSKAHRSSKSVSLGKGGGSSRTDLEQRLKEESDRTKRLEMSMAAMRAENRALLDRIQALEYEKDLSWRSLEEIE